MKGSSSRSVSVPSLAASLGNGGSSGVLAVASVSPETSSIGSSPALAKDGRWVGEEIGSSAASDRSSNGGSSTTATLSDVACPGVLKPGSSVAVSLRSTVDSLRAKVSEAASVTDSEFSSTGSCVTSTSASVGVEAPSPAASSLLFRITTTPGAGCVAAVSSRSEIAFSIWLASKSGSVSAKAGVSVIMRCIIPRISRICSTGLS